MSKRALTLVDAASSGAGEPGFATFSVGQATRALDALRELIPSRPMVAHIFEGKQLVDAEGRVVPRDAMLSEASLVTLRLQGTRAVAPASAEPPVVLYQDPFLLAVDKPQGILVHGDGSTARTLTACVQGYLLEQGVDAVPQALHRLDVDTSGIVLFSLAEETQPAFDALIAGSGMSKRYYAVVRGRLPKALGAWVEVDAPIARDRHDARRMRVGRSGKPALTRFRPVSSRGGLTLVEAELGSGRRHQIRVHLAHLGHPIVGDALYGGERCESGLLLHAHEVCLEHPISNKQLVIESPLPGRFPQFR